jgi:tellurite resistance protein
VEICGTINAPGNMHHLSVRISITDITSKELPVQSCVAKWQMEESPVFCYSSDLGKISSAKTTLSGWITAAQIKLDWLRFPRRGRRNLRFTTSILSCEGGDELARAACTFTYDNSAFGYIDLQENIQRVKTLTVALGFAVSACDNKLYNCEVELIKNWARINIGASQASRKAARKLEKALNKILAFCLNGNKIDAYKICKELVELVPVAERYDILDLCLHVAQAKGVATEEELFFLRKLASWLEVDADKFSSMIEKILPVNINEIKDAVVFLGITPDMSKEQTRRYLNKAYRKWNARVTNFDPKIQAQADCMLKFIAEARRAHVG